MNDAPIHLLNYWHICKPQEHHEPSVTIPIWITQSSLDGMNALIRYCEGVERAGGGMVPGAFEVVMFYRTIRSTILDADSLERERQNRPTDIHQQEEKP